MRRLLFFLIIFLSILVVAFFAWRNPAPAGDGTPIVLQESGEDGQEFIFFGDNGSGEPDQFKLAAAMERYCLNHKVRAVFMLGDNFYPAGVKSVDDPQWQSKFREPYEKPCLGQVPFYAVLGNHDYRGHPAAQIAYSKTQRHWHMPNRFYSVQFGEIAKIIAIDTNYADLCGLSSFCVLDFMRAALKDSAVPLRIVIGHHPMQSASGKYGTTSFLGRVLRWSMCKTGAIYIAGHSHHLEHRQDADCSLELFVSGGGGASLYEIRRDDPDTRFAQSEHGFLRLRASKAGNDFTFFDSELKELYSYRHR